MFLGDLFKVKEVINLSFLFNEHEDSARVEEDESRCKGYMLPANIVETFQKSWPIVKIEHINYLKSPPDLSIFRNVPK